MVSPNDARIGYGRIGYLPIGGLPDEVAYESDLAVGEFVIELRLQSGELVNVLHRAFNVGYEEQVDAIGRAWAALSMDDSKWNDVAQGRILTVREHGHRPKNFIIRRIRERRE